MNDKQGLSESLLKIPILSNFNQSQLVTQQKNLKPGAKILFYIFSVAIGLGLIYFAWFVLLPMLAWMFQVVAAGLITLAAFIFYRPIVDLLKSFSRRLHKMAIENDPFIVLERQKRKIGENRETVYKSQGQIGVLRDDMKSSAKVKEKEVSDLTSLLRGMKLKAEQLLKEKESYSGSKDDDAYIDLTLQIDNLKRKIIRDSHLLEQFDSLAQKYAIRGKKMNDLYNKLKIVISSMDSKVADYEISIEMLKTDYEFARKSRMATDAAKSAMLFDKDWKLEYAIDVIENTIANDISMTEMNMKDLESFTKNFDIDNDLAFDNLDKLLANIDSGEKVLTNTKKYNNPEYRETESDREASGFKMFK